MTVEHGIQISRGEVEQLKAAKFWSIGWLEEVPQENQLEGKQIEFRGGKWRVDMVGVQLSLNNHVAGVKEHPEPTQVELIATIWGSQRVRVLTEEGEYRIDEMCGPLTKEESLEASYCYVERPNQDPVLRIVHPVKGSFDVQYSITMPTESHQTAYSRGAGCIAMKMTLVNE